MAELPVVVEIWRGDHLESRHRGSAIALDAKGRRLLAFGDVTGKVFPRSAIKPLQSSPLVETGAASALGLSPAEIALACASHSGEPQHTDRVRQWLEQLGLTPDALGCGPQSPSHTPTKLAMIRQDLHPDKSHNNCSGKHTGMLTVASHLGEDLSNYLAIDHPVQQRVHQTLEQLCGESLDWSPGTDGCSAPNWPISLSGLATGASRLALGDGTTPAQSSALSAMGDAMQAYPQLVAGTGRCCTAIMQSSNHVLAKTGAEGVYILAHRPTGTGIALKIDDGATRAAETLAIGLLHKLSLLDDQECAGLASFFQPVIRNFAGLDVGQVKLAKDWQDH